VSAIRAENIMELRLIILSQCKWQGKAVAVRRFPFLIGRGPICQFRVTSARMAERHCELLGKSGRVWVRDIDSGGRTFLNGWRVTGKQELHHGDRLQVGPLEFGIRLTPTPSTEKAKALAAALIVGESNAAAEPSTPSAAHLALQRYLRRPPG
jgi:predicted component of type VI protein secretion system